MFKNVKWFHPRAWSIGVHKLQKNKSCDYELDTLKVSTKKIHSMRFFQWQCMHLYISYCKKIMKRNPNYEIEENQNPNPKKILL
jgi:hypothetical protein